MKNSFPSRRSFLAGGSSLLAMACFAKAARTPALFQLRVENQLPFDRSALVLEVPLEEIQRHTRRDAAKLIVLDHATQERLLTQVYGSSSESGAAPDRLLILVKLPAHAKTILSFHVDESAVAQASRVTARLVPERMDDFAWENDKIAFRVYGPALQATGEITSGIDVWCKRVPDFVTRSWYERDRLSRTNPSMSYHRDNGQGLDSYDVGKSLGCGGTAVWENGALLPSKNFVSSRILAMGPIRTEFVLDYAAWDADGVRIRETKRISLDAGSHLNHIRSTYRLEGSRRTTVAAGVAVHDGAEVKKVPEQSLVAVWDTPQLASAGHIATAVLAAGRSAHEVQQSAAQKDRPADAFLLFDVMDGSTVDYFAGAGWSQADIPTFEDWMRILEQYRQSTLNPALVS